MTSKLRELTDSIAEMRLKLAEDQNINTLENKINEILTATQVYREELSNNLENAGLLKTELAIDIEFDPPTFEYALLELVEELREIELREDPETALILFEKISKNLTKIQTSNLRLSDANRRNWESKRKDAGLGDNQAKLLELAGQDKTQIKKVIRNAEKLKTAGLSPTAITAFLDLEDAKSNLLQNFAKLDEKVQDFLDALLSLGGADIEALDSQEVIDWISLVGAGRFVIVLREDEPQ